jgi:hypothetical protein
MNRSIAAAALVVSAVATAHASTVQSLSPDELYAGADRVVEATVVSRQTAWNATRTGFETHVVLGVHATLKGPADATVTIVVPGGELDGARHVIVGMPSVNVGETARWFVRGERVYGWAQGKWPAKTIAGATVFEPAPVAAERDQGFLEFTTNGMVWPANRIPVPYLIHSTGSADIPLAQVIATFDAAFATWQAVPCSSLAFTNAGMTTLGVAIDGMNVMLFIESGWIYGAEAAAATSLFIIDGQQTADIAVNGENWTWAIGPSGASFGQKVLDLQGVLTHEIGHFSGLGHTMRAFDTMNYSWTPWQGQRSLSIDDKLGLCSIYPVAGDECPAPACPTGETCTDHANGKLCEGTPDPVGAACNYDRAECTDFCLFTVADFSNGYCSKFCASNMDCPLTHHCANASAGGMPVKVCFAGAQPTPMPDAGPNVEPCTDDGACPIGSYCDTTAGACTFECRVSADCNGGDTCDGRGRCASESGGCGCRTMGRGGLLMLVVVGIFLVGRRR